MIKLKKDWGCNTVITLRGNHEQMRLDSIKNGYCSDVHSQEEEFLNSLPLYYEDEYCFYVHAGANPLNPLNRQDADDLLWIREGFYNCSNDFKKTIVFGHTPTQLINGTISPVIWENKIALDTGCVFGGRLTALEMSDGKVLNVYAQKKISA